MTFAVVEDTVIFDKGTSESGMSNVLPEKSILFETRICGVGAMTIEETFEVVKPHLVSLSLILKLVFFVRFMNRDELARGLLVQSGEAGKQLDELQYCQTYSVVEGNVANERSRTYGLQYVPGGIGLIFPPRNCAIVTVVIGVIPRHVRLPSETS